MRRAGRIVALIVDVFEAVLQTAGIQVSDVCAAQRFRLKADGRLAPAQLCPRTQDQHATTQIRQCIISLCGTTEPRHKHTKRTHTRHRRHAETPRAHINSTRLPAAYWQDHNNSGPVCRCIYRKCVCVFLGPSAWLVCAKRCYITLTVLMRSMRAPMWQRSHISGLLSSRTSKMRCICVVSSSLKPVN